MKLHLRVAMASLILVSSSISLSPAHAQPIGDKEAARTKVAMCIGCHGIEGYKASFPTVYPVPKIGGQNAKYLENSLQAYKKGDRSHPTMRGIAGSLSDKDMADLAAYYAAQRPVAAAK
jgi:cytochrome c553